MKTTIKISINSDIDLHDAKLRNCTQFSEALFRNPHLHNSVQNPVKQLRRFLFSKRI